MKLVFREVSQSGRYPFLPPRGIGAFSHNRIGDYMINVDGSSTEPLKYPRPG